MISPDPPRQSLGAFLLLARMEALHFVLAGLTIAWGMWVVTGFGTVLPVTLSAFPEFAVAVAVFVVGVVQLLGFGLRQYRTHLVAQFLSGLGWLYVAIAFILSGSRSTAIPVYLVLFLASAWCVVRLMTDHANATKTPAA